MKYKYLYQTKENENREGWVTAKNREAAYHKLRIMGIRPYRVIGDDPVNWMPWAGGALVVVLALALWVVLSSSIGMSDRSPRLRQQITGDAEIIAKGVATDWSDQLSTTLDRCLVAYAQPGGSAVPPHIEEAQLESLKADLDKPLEYDPGERTEYRQMRNIVAFLRDEMRENLEAGMSVKEHFEFLEARQREEIELRQRAQQSIEKAGESYRAKMAASVNAQLKARGIKEIKL